MISVEVVRPERVCVDGDTRNIKYWAGLVNFSEGQRLVELFIDNLPIRK